jgi:hypothetical protein
MLSTVTERGSFPKFEEKGPYREPGQRPLAQEPGPPRRVAPKPAPTRKSFTPATTLPQVNVGREEREFWKRHSFARRHPRLVALLVAAVGALATWHSLSVLAGGGVYRLMGTLGSPAMFLGGLWALLFGVPEDEDGRPTAWWFNGMVLCVLFGCGLGVWLLYHLMYATTVRF